MSDQGIEGLRRVFPHEQFARNRAEPIENTSSRGLFLVVSEGGRVDITLMGWVESVFRRIGTFFLHNWNCLCLRLKVCSNWGTFEVLELGCRRFRSPARNPTRKNGTLFERIPSARTSIQNGKTAPNAASHNVSSTANCSGAL